MTEMMKLVFVGSCLSLLVLCGIFCLGIVVRMLYDEFKNLPCDVACDYSHRWFIYGKFALKCVLMVNVFVTVFSMFYVIGSYGGM